MRSSIARRLHFSLIGAITVLWFAAALAVALVVRHETEEIFDSSLQETSQRVLALAVRELELDPTHNWPDHAEPVDQQEYINYQVLNARGEILLRSQGAPAQPYPASSQAGHQTVNGQHFYFASSRDGAYVIKAAERSRHREDFFSDTLVYLSLPFGALLPITALVIYLTVKRSQRSILKFGADIAQRDSRELHPIHTDTLPVELLRVGEAVNSLMHRLQLALEAERGFAANSAHELRTPIAAALAQLDVLRDEVTAADDQARVADARRMIERLEQMTVKLLQLAKAESGSALDCSRMDLSGLTAMLLRDESFRSKRRMDFSTPDLPVWVGGDLDAVGIVIQNLLENADRYAPPGTPIEITITPQGALIVKNDCAAIPAGTLRSLCDRFVRANQLKPGSGIGLSIVDTILRQCDAELVLRSPCYENGRGFMASACFKTM